MDVVGLITIVVLAAIFWLAYKIFASPRLTDWQKIGLPLVTVTYNNLL